MKSKAKSRTKRRPSKAKAPDGYRRVWTLPVPPQVGTANKLYPEAQRMYKRGPQLEALPADAARVSEYPVALTGRLQDWDASLCSNWDLYPASILLSIGHELVGAQPVRNEFSAHHGCVGGPRSSVLGFQYSVVALVTRSENPDLHVRERRALAAALRDAADLVEGKVDEMALPRRRAKGRRT
jgi:hypothetical protein